MHAAASKHLAGLCEWSLPKGGMFLWIKAFTEIGKKAGLFAKLQPGRARKRINAT